MPSEIYEVVAQGARYWFLFLMVLIVWRSWRWYRKDQKQAKKRLKLLPDAGYVGEMVVVEGGGALQAGDVLMVPREGTVGSLRTNDLCVQAKGVAKRHLWFRFDDGQGLMVEPLGKNAVNVDGEDFKSRREPLYMMHGSRLYLGECQLRLRLFAGFESIGYASRQTGVEEVHSEPQMEDSQPVMTPEQMAQWQQQWMQQQMQAMQQAYQMGYEHAQQHWQEEEEEEPIDEDSLPFDMAQIAQEEGMVDHRMFMRPEGQKKPELPPMEPEEEQTFYPPEMDEGWMDDEDSWDAFDEDMTDAASAPPRSAYIGRDESEQAKKQLWDKYFGGGGAR